MGLPLDLSSLQNRNGALSIMKLIFWKKKNKLKQKLNQLEKNLNYVIDQQHTLIDLFSSLTSHNGWCDSHNDLLHANNRMLTSLVLDNYKETIIKLGLYDDDYYTQNYPEYKKYGLSGLDHYLSIGWQMFYNPSSTFNTKQYLDGQPLLQICPLIHFLQNGRYYASYAYFSKNPPILPRVSSILPTKRCVYTCLVGDYDNIKQQSYVDKNWDYICFTDNKELLNKKQDGIWQFRPLLRTDLDSTRINRYHKILPHIVLSEYTESIYIDSNIDILSPFIFDLVEARKYVGLLLPGHFLEKCSYEHAKWILTTQKDETPTINEFLEKIRNDGFPINFGMTENNIIYRNHNNQRIKNIMDEWWLNIVKYCKRDQLSLTYLLWKDGIALKDICFANARNNIEHFKFIRHKQ